MANVYVRSGAAGAGTGADWANAYTTLAAACTAKAAGDIFYVSEDHAEVTAGAVTINAPGTVTSPNQILCVNHLGTVPPVAADLRTTATISTTGANAITTNGFFYCYGIIFQSSSTGGAVAGGVLLAQTVGNYQRYDNCVFRALGTSATANLINGNATSYAVLNNCTWKFASTSSNIGVFGSVLWQNSTIFDAAGSIPGTVFNVQPGSIMIFEGDDFSALSSSVLTFGQSCKFYLKDCKLPASAMNLTSQGAGPFSSEVYVTRCSSAAGNAVNERHSYSGDLTTETTIVRTGGASDGTTPVAHKIVTTATIRWQDPFTAIPISIWNDTAGSVVNVTVCGIWGGGAVPNNDDIWIDVEYLGASGNPQGSFVSSSKASILAANAACPSDTSTWGGSTTKFKMTVAITPQQKGPITVYVRCAKPSSTFYVDPLVTLT